MESIRTDNESCGGMGVQGVSLWVQGRLKFHNKHWKGRDQGNAENKRERSLTERLLLRPRLSSRMSEITSSYSLVLKYISRDCLRISSVAGLTNSIQRSFMLFDVMSGNLSYY